MGRQHCRETEIRLQKFKVTISVDTARHCTACIKVSLDSQPRGFWVPGSVRLTDSFTKKFFLPCSLKSYGSMRSTKLLHRGRRLVSETISSEISCRQRAPNVVVEIKTCGELRTEQGCLGIGPAHRPKRLSEAPHSWQFWTYHRQAALLF